MFFPSTVTGDVLSCLTHEKCELILHCHVSYGHPEDINIAQRFSGSGESYVPLTQVSSLSPVLLLKLQKGEIK